MLSQFRATEKIKKILRIALLAAAALLAASGKLDEISAKNGLIGQIITPKE